MDVEQFVQEHVRTATYKGVETLEVSVFLLV